MSNSQRSTFGCPEGCGARYVQWLNPISQKHELMCVVCPIFEEQEEESNARLHAAIKETREYLEINSDPDADGDCSAS